MDELAVLTFTKGDRPDWLHQCVQSVSEQLPSTAFHEIVECGSYAETDKQRLASITKAKFIVFVDDDDYVINDSISKCLRAIKETGAGIAFTDEFLIKENGEPVRKDAVVRSRVMYNNIYTQPTTVHHLAVIRTEAILPREDILSLGLDSRIDWLMKGSAALRGGAVRIPEFGYCWRQHTSARHINPTESEFYNDNVSKTREYLEQYKKFKGQTIPEYLIK